MFKEEPGSQWWGGGSEGTLTLRKEAIPSQQWMDFSDKNILPHEKQIGDLICLEQKCTIDSIYLSNSGVFI